MADPRLSYWPTPVKQELNIAADGSYQQVEVVDMLGRVHYRDATLAGKTALSFDLSRLAAGVYLVRVQGEQKPARFRIIKALSSAQEKAAGIPANRLGGGLRFGEYCF